MKRLAWLLVLVALSAASGRARPGPGAGVTIRFAPTCSGPATVAADRPNIAAIRRAMPDTAAGVYWPGYQIGAQVPVCRRNGFANFAYRGVDCRSCGYGYGFGKTPPGSGLLRAVLVSAAGSRRTSLFLIAPLQS